jgi:PAS domain S-box-containing protein
MIAAEELLESLPCGFVSFSDDGQVLATNATLRAMLGYERGALEGRHVETLFTVAGRIFYQTHFFPLLRLHGKAEEIFLLLRTKQGGEVGALVNGVRRERGDAAVNDCVLLEVRERRKYEDELLRARRAAESANAALAARTRDLEEANARLEQQALELELQQQQLQEQTAAFEHARDAAEEANRAKSQFLAAMSHELRTPLNAISGYVQLLELGIHGPLTDAQRDALDRVGRSQRHLLRLINDVLNLARIEAGRVEYRIEPVSVADLVTSVVPMVEPQMLAKRLTFTSTVDPGFVARVDRDKVQQILINLLSNALKFTPPAGQVTLSAASDPSTGRVLVCVTDTGTGIATDKLESIFAPFVQVRVDHAERTEGTGLGLAISRDLARGMGGDLTAVSVPGEGSTFTLALPGA